MQKRWALSVPLEDFTLRELPDVALEAAALGYSDMWSAEVDGSDCFSPLAALAMRTELRLGTAIVNAYTRGPQAIASAALGMASLAPGRFVLGIGSGSAITVERWNSLKYYRPATRVKEVVQVVRAALAGERVVFKGETININGFKLSRLPDQPIPIHVAGLRAGMLGVAGEVADGAILNWLGAGDVHKSIATTRLAAEKAGRDPMALEFSARLFVSLDEPGAPDTNEVLRRFVTFYLNVPTYRRFMEWLGRGPDFVPMWEAWDGGDRKEAVARVPQRALDELFIVGSPKQRRAHLQRYFDAGLDTAFMHFMTNETDPLKRKAMVRQAIKDMAP
jgi:probable F420-dependent oxidoreductase